LNSASRLPRGEASALRLVSRLTERDRSILRLLRSHRVFTTEQLTHLFFDSVNTAQHRLSVLYQLRLVDRFRPLDGGHVLGPYHYVLDEFGAMVVAAERDDTADLAQVRWRTEQALAIGRSQRLAHQVGVNGFFVGLSAAARRAPARMRLVEWWSETRCRESFGALARPDGLGVWEEDGTRIGFLLEYDRSTEPLSRLADKLPGYEKLRLALDNDFYWLIFVFRSERREAGARAALANAPVPVATAALRPTQPPCGAIWAPIGQSGERLRLIDLATPHRPSTARVR
jgi:hypothetical protein